MSSKTPTAPKEVQKSKNVKKMDAKTYYNELVSVKLFKDNNKYKDDVFVAVNGVGMLVPRGKEVQIPRKFAIALEKVRPWWYDNARIF